MSYLKSKVYDIGSKLLKQRINMSWVSSINKVTLCALLELHMDNTLYLQVFLHDLDVTSLISVPVLLTRSATFPTKVWICKSCLLVFQYKTV
jgi:hypothetical protein